MAIRVRKLLDENIQSSSSVSAQDDLAGVTPKRATLQIEVTKTGSPVADLVLTVEVSPDAGTTLITYDKLLDHNGTDAPQSSVTYTSASMPVDDIVSLSPEDVYDYIKVTATPSNITTLDASNYFTIKVWLVVAY